MPSSEKYPNSAAGNERGCIDQRNKTDVNRMLANQSNGTAGAIQNSEPPLHVVESLRELSQPRITSSARTGGNVAGIDG